MGAEQRVVPDGRSELIVNLGQSYESLQRGQWQRQPQAFVAGQITGPLLLRSRGDTRIFGVRFHPHGASQVLKMPMPDVTGSFVDLQGFSGGDPSFEGQIAQFEKLAGVREDEDLLVTHAVSRMVDAGGIVEIAAFAAMAGISCRQFERRFLSLVGLPPKLFCRIQRFQKIFAALEQPGTNWVNAAIECGYYDQAHLIRDFKEFTGRTPSVFFTEADFAGHFLSHFSKTPPRALR